MQQDETDPRARAQSRLEELVGRGELSLSEFSDRAKRIWAASNPQELNEAMAGLPGAPGQNPAAAGQTPTGVERAASPGLPVQRSYGSNITVAEDASSTTVFETVKRDGRWHLPDEVELTSWMGEIFLDFRDAIVDQPRTRMKINAWGADARLLLPPGVSVSVTGRRTWGSLKIDEGNYEVRGGPHLDLEINGFMSTVKIKVLPSGARIPATWKWF